jgi:dihydroorotate dehydrogenase (fumarate)
VGRFRIFRYEIRLWFGGHTPDVAEALDSPRRLTIDEDRARRVLDLIGQVPTPAWGRDELATGDMWNSNSVIAWVIALQRVKSVVTVPVAVKLSPYFSSMGEMALRLDEAGADALVLFNRFLQPDIDPEELALSSTVALSSTADARLPRTWIALLRGQVRAALAATGGVEAPADVAKYLLAGADVVMTASALLRHGTEYAGVLLDGLSTWMARKGFRSVDDLRGMLSVPHDVDEAAYERTGYVSALRAANARAHGPW